MRQIIGTDLNTLSFRLTEKVNRLIPNDKEKCPHVDTPHHATGLRYSIRRTEPVFDRIRIVSVEI
jgi:hypothetical protein